MRPSAWKSVFRKNKKQHTPSEELGLLIQAVAAGLSKSIERRLGFEDLTIYRTVCRLLSTCANHAANLKPLPFLCNRNKPPIETTRFINIDETLTTARWNNRTDRGTSKLIGERLVISRLR